MTCNYDRERLALFAGGELSPAEGELVQAHLGACPECGAIVAQYRAGAWALADALAAAPVPSQLGRRRAVRTARIPVAAAVLVILLAVTLAQSSVLAGVLRWFQVREVTPEEARQIAGRVTDSNVVVPLTDSATPYLAPELEKRYGLPVAHPELGPEWEWLSVTILRDDPPGYIRSHYQRAGGGSLYITQTRTPMERTQLVAQGMSRQVTVNGQEAWIIRGAFVKVSEAHPDGYDERGNSILYFEWQGQEMEVWFHHPFLTREQREAELIRIAESLK